MEERASFLPPFLGVAYNSQLPLLLLSRLLFLHDNQAPLLPLPFGRLSFLHNSHLPFPPPNRVRSLMHRRVLPTPILPSVSKENTPTRGKDSSSTAMFTVASIIFDVVVALAALVLFAVFMKRRMFKVR